MARSLVQELVEAARRLDPGRLRFVTRYLRHCADPDGALRAENRAHELRFFNLSQTLDGAFMLDGQLDAEGGALLRTAISALNKPLPEDMRTAGQRRADALTELAARMLRSESLPTTHGQRPHLIITAGEDQRLPEPADLAGVGPVSRRLLDRLACDASETKVRVDECGTPLGVSDTRPVIPASLRAALAVRDRGCRFPNCDRPPEWTDAHHVTPRSEGGHRTLDNLVLLCRVHHRLVHEGGWKLVWNGSAVIEAVPP
jgi:hypothetical protein